MVELYVSFSFTLRETRLCHFHHIIKTQISLQDSNSSPTQQPPLITITRLFILFTVRMCNYNNRVISRVLILLHFTRGALMFCVILMLFSGLVAGEPEENQICRKISGIFLLCMNFRKSLSLVPPQKISSNTASRLFKSYLCLSTHISRFLLFLIAILVSLHPFQLLIMHAIKSPTI